jgi:hypothetical protein
MDFFENILFRAFLLPLLRNAQKRVKKSRRKKKKKKKNGVSH